MKKNILVQFLGFSELFYQKFYFIVVNACFERKKKISSASNNTRTSFFMSKKVFLRFNNLAPFVWL
jgi:hypothetical protein